MKLSSWYDYSQVVYVDMDTDIIIGCPIHGYFKQNPYRHRTGSNCPYCSGKSIFNPKNKEEIKDYWIENKISGNMIWYKHWKDSNLREQGYPSCPWVSFRMTCIEWTEYVGGKKKTKEEIKKYWLAHKITGSEIWRRHWKDNNLKEQGYLYSPWEQYKMTAAKWTEYVWGRKLIKTKDETKKYWLENKIKSCRAWIKHWKCENLQAQGYYSNTWTQYKMTNAEWTEYVWGRKLIKTKDETKKYWLENKITNSRIWYKHWKCENLQEQGYYSKPGESYKMTDAEWTEYVWNKNK